MAIEYEELVRTYQEAILGYDEPDLMILKSELRLLPGRKRRTRFVAVPGFGWMTLRQIQAEKRKANRNAL
jgi:hypothetical protein